MRTDPLVLDLTEARAALLVHRDGTWMRAGEARFGAADFREQAAGLVARARALAPAGAAARPAIVALLPETELITGGIAAEPPQGAAPDPDLCRKALGPAGDRADLAISARADGGWLIVHALPREVVRQTERFLDSIGLGLAAIVVPLADGATPAWFPPADQAGMPMPPALAGFERRGILAHPPADLAERLAADARSRAAARLDPAHLRPLEDAPSAPQRRTGWRWQAPIRLRRGATRPVALTAALCVGLAAAAVWLPPLVQRNGTGPATDLATADAPAALGPVAPSPPARPEVRNAQAQAPDAHAPSPEERAEAADPEPDMAANAGRETAKPAEVAGAAPETAGPAPTTAPIPATNRAADYFTPLPLLATPPGASAPPGDDLTQPSLDPIVGLDPTMLAHNIQPPALPQPPGLAAPPPPEQRFSVDARGLVVPSAAGRITPDGHMVFAGQPPALPRSRPEELVAARLAEAEATPPPVLDRADLAEDDPLKQLSPRQRPDGLRERTERVQLGGRTEQELAGLRPAPRPDAVLTRVAAIAAAPPAAAQGAGVPRPDERPEDLPAEQRQAAATRSGADAGRAASTAALSGAAQPNRSAGGTTAAVAAAATQRGFNLSQVSLLGTFGPSGKLRALVRLPGGDVLNLSVGDRVDGGRVQAINAGRLIYVKGGRSVTLNMPNG